MRTSTQSDFQVACVVGLLELGLCVAERHHILCGLQNRFDAVNGFKLLLSSPCSVFLFCALIF